MSKALVIIKSMGIGDLAILIASIHAISKKIDKPMPSDPIKKKADISYNKISRFNSLASKRVTETMKSISLIGNLSNTYAYDYSDSDINKINEALDNAIVELKMKFNASNKITEFEL